MKNDKPKLKTVRSWYKELIFPNMKLKAGVSVTQVTESMNKLDDVKKITESDFREIFMPKPVKPTAIAADLAKKEIRIFDPFGNYIKK